jgi:uncharacterized protein (UPF0261 family)
MRTDALENEQLGSLLAQKVNQSKAAVTVVLPLNGISQVDAEGGVFFQPATDRVLFDAIKANLSGTVGLIDSPRHINDQAFAELLVTSLLELIELNRRTDAVLSNPHK